MTANLPGWKGPKKLFAELPPFPRPLAYLWAWFHELLAGAASGPSGPCVTWEGIAAWSALTGNAPEPWEAKAIVRLGSAFAASLVPPKPADKPR